MLNKIRKLFHITQKSNTRITSITNLSTELNELEQMMVRGGKAEMKPYVHYDKAEM